MDAVLSVVDAQRRVVRDEHVNGRIRAKKPCDFALVLVEPCSSARQITSLLASTVPPPSESARVELSPSGPLSLGGPSMPHRMRAGVIAVCLVTLLYIADHGGSSMAEPQPSSQFEIYVIADRLIDVLPYDYENPAWKHLLKTPPPGSVILADTDIESYDWEEQEIVLGAAASERLGGQRLIERSFIVFLGKRPLLGGSFVERGSARAIDYPVIYVDKSRPRVVFQLRPRHTMFESYRELDAQTRARIELPDLKRHFKALGKLR